MPSNRLTYVRRTETRHREGMVAISVAMELLGYAVDSG